MKIETAKVFIGLLGLKTYQTIFALKQIKKYKDEIPDNVFFDIIEDARFLEEYDVIIIGKSIPDDTANVKITTIYKRIPNVCRYDSNFERIYLNKLNRKIMEINDRKRYIIVFNNLN